MKCLYRQKQALFLTISNFAAVCMDQKLESNSNDMTKFVARNLINFKSENALQSLCLLDQKLILNAAKLSAKDSVCETSQTIMQCGITFPPRNKYFKNQSQIEWIATTIKTFVC